MPTNSPRRGAHRRALILTTAAAVAVGFWLLRPAGDEAGALRPEAGGGVPAVPAQHGGRVAGVADPAAAGGPAVPPPAPVAGAGPRAPLPPTTGRAIWFGFPDGPPSEVPAVRDPRGPGAEVRALLEAHRDALGLDGIPGELRVAREFDSISGHHLRLTQFYEGLEVEDSEVSSHIGPDGRPLLVAADAFDVRGVPTTPVVAAAEAATAARAVLDDVVAGADDPADTPDAADTPAAPAVVVRDPRLVIVPFAKSGRLAWRVDVKSAAQSSRLWIDARDGSLVRERDLRRAADGVADVFDPNPVYTSRNGLLRDRRDSDAEILAVERKRVTLRRLDGTGALRGDYADLSRSLGHEFRANLDWTRVSRAAPLFEAVMCYHHVDTIQARLQSIGITGVNASRQDIDAHATPDDQSFYDGIDDTLNFGDGGVDDGEDADIIHHEYGHAIQDDQVVGFGATLEGGALGEGFSDYLAVWMRISGDDRFDAAVGSWDATSYSRKNPPALRRVDGDKRYPKSVVHEVHDDGEIWSRFLWDLAHEIGFDEATQVVIGSHDLLNANARFLQGASAVISANIAIRGGADDAEIRELLRVRGLPYSNAPRPAPPEDAFEPNDFADSAAPIVAGDYQSLLLADDDWYSVTADPFRRIVVTSTFDSDAIDLDLALHRADGAFLTGSDSAGYTESVEATAGSGGATFLVRAFRGGGSTSARGYRLIISDAPLETLPTGPALVRSVESVGTYAFRIAVPDAKVGGRITISSDRKAGGAVNDLRVTSPSGVVADFGQGRRPTGARTSVRIDEPGEWFVELRPRAGSGKFAVRAKFGR